MAQEQEKASEVAPTAAASLTNGSNEITTTLPLPAERTATDWKNVGNAAYALQDYETATAAYKQGLKASEEDNDSGTSDDLRRTLYANLALVLVKSKDYVQAEAWCNRALQDQQMASSSSTTSTTTTSTAKIWYRRALAREGRAQEELSSNAPSKAKEFLLQAKGDLQRSLEELQRHPVSGKERDRMQESIGSLAQRLQRALNELEAAQSLQSVGGSVPPPPPPPEAPSTPKRKGGTPTANHENNKTTATANTPLVSPESVPPATTPQRPTVKQQRQDVVRLLLARATAERGHVALPGEAFYFLDWDWWCDWCAYVNLFDASNKQWTEKLLENLVVGALLPDAREDEPEDPGPLDNRRLLFPPVSHLKNGDKETRQVFQEHWYQHLLKGAAAAASEKEDQGCCLAPHLIRGQDYEILPREVYAALRSWYGEVTPPICRRAAVTVGPKNGKATPRLSLKLYPSTTTSTTDLASSVCPCNTCGAPRATSRCKQCMSVRYCGRTCQESHWPFHKADCKALVAAETEEDASSPPTLMSEPSFGKVGLNNLGNTCFMNSPIQALSHATPLTRHFLSSRFRSDLNPSNPLGTGGKLANAYETVLKDLWLRPASMTSTSPSALKRAIALFAPRFAGYLQHDAQEFLAYLLDGLHEDLNRIRKAPYVEMPQVEDGQNMAVAGAKAWEAHRRRNDSLVMDTFYGQFKSTCVCPQCNRVSVSFDTFNHVSLEIPQAKNAIMPLSFLVFGAPPTNGEKPVVPTRYGLEIRRSSSVADVRQALSTLTSIPTDRLVLCEAFDHAIVDMLQDPRPVSRLRSNDFYVAYDIDPFTDTTYHVIANHLMVESNTATDIRLKPFGFPLMTSFSAGLTCKEIWNHLWALVGPMVTLPESTTGDSIDGKELLKVRLHNGRGKPVPAFRVQQEEEDEEEEQMTDFEASLLPAELDQPLTDFLGKDSTDSFLFIKLEWTNMEVTSAQDPTETTSLINMDRFLFMENHPSYIEVAKKMKAASNSKGVTLDQCFETFTKPERLDDNNKWYCSNCKEHVRALKTMELWRLPNILIVHLKRFEFKHALRRDKLDTLVNFPLEGLDMSAHCAATATGDSPFVDDSLPAEYDLFSVTNHFGRMGFGHYTAFCRKWDEHGIDKDWYLFDDSNVRSVGDGRGRGGGIDGVVTPAAYVLYYRRRAFA